MSVFNLHELEQLVDGQLPQCVRITSYRHADNNIVLCLSVPTAVPYKRLEELRQAWEAQSSWRIAIDTFYFSPDLDAQIIDTAVQISPSATEIKGVMREGDDLVLMTTNVVRLYGRDNKVYDRLNAAFPDFYISIQAADPTNRSANLESVNRKITDTLDCGGVLGQVRNLVPSEIFLRSIAMEVPSRTLTLKYGTPRITADRLHGLEQQIAAETGWNVKFRKLIDSDNLVQYVKDHLPHTLPKCRVGYHRNKEYIEIQCRGDVTHAQLLEEIIADFARTLPVDVRYRLVFRDDVKAQIVTDLVPESWGFEKASYNGREGVAMLTCTTPPTNPDDPTVQQIVADLSARLGMRIVFRGSEYEEVRDEAVLARMKELVPSTSGFHSLLRHAINGEYRVQIKRNPQHIKVRDLKRALGVKNVVLKIAPDEAKKSPFVKAVLNLVDSEGKPDIVRVRARKYGKLVGYGACEEVGRSCFYLELSGLRVLIDCGTSFGPNPIPTIPRKQMGELDYVLLSHAHTDHSTLIPWLYNQNCAAQLISTEPTLVIGKVLMEDYLKVQKQYRREKPVFGKEDIKTALSHACIVDFHQRHRIGENTFVTFIPSGHILGAAMILIEDKGERVLYSGDLSCVDTRVLLGAKIPPNLDHIIIETTYGGKQHRTREESERYFLERLEGVLEKGGTVVIPSFAVGRAQEILTILNQHPKLGHNKKFPVYVDGMILGINDIHKTYLASDRELHVNPQLKEDKNIFTSDRLFTRITRREVVFADKNPKVILSTSGMCEGLAAYYLSAFIEDPRNLLMFVGYQAPGNLGYELREGKKQVRIDGKKYRVKIQVDSVGFSGHADQEQILEQLRGSRLKTLVTVHGDSPAMKAFAAEARRRVNPQRVVEPTLNQEVTLY